MQEIRWLCLVNHCRILELVRAYLLVGGGGHCREETIKALVNPRQAEMAQMIEPRFAPAHAYPFEALLNEPLAGAFHQATANRQTGGFELVILNMSFMRFQLVIHVG